MDILSIAGICADAEREHTSNITDPTARKLGWTWRTVSIRPPCGVTDRRVSRAFPGLHRMLAVPLIIIVMLSTSTSHDRIATLHAAYTLYIIQIVYIRLLVIFSKGRLVDSGTTTSVNMTNRGCHTIIDSLQTC